MALASEELRTATATITTVTVARAVTATATLTVAVTVAGVRIPVLGARQVRTPDRHGDLLPITRPHVQRLDQHAAGPPSKVKGVRGMQADESIRVMAITAGGVHLQGAGQVARRIRLAPIVDSKVGL